MAAPMKSPRFDMATSPSREELPMAGAFETPRQDAQPRLRDGQSQQFADARVQLLLVRDERMERRGRHQVVQRQPPRGELIRPAGVDGDLPVLLDRRTLGG